MVMIVLGAKSGIGEEPSTTFWDLGRHVPNSRLSAANKTAEHISAKAPATCSARNLNIHPSCLSEHPYFTERWRLVTVGPFEALGSTATLATVESSRCGSNNSRTDQM